MVVRHPPSLDLRAFGSTAEVAALVGDVLDASSDLSIIATDADGLVLVWSEGAERLYGYSQAEAVRHPWARLFVEEDVRRGLPEQIMRKAGRSGRWKGSVARVRKDGSHFTATVSITARRDARGGLIGFLLISSDVTRAYARSLLASAPDAMVVVDPTGAS